MIPVLHADSLMETHPGVDRKIPLTKFMMNYCSPLNTQEGFTKLGYNSSHSTQLGV